MKSMDSLQKHRPRSRPTPSSKRRTSSEPTDIADRRRKMWLAVGATMIVIILGWFSLSQWGTNAPGSNPFRTIANQFHQLFSEDAEPTPVNAVSEEDTEQLRELRNRVFPQFEETNTNAEATTP